MQWFADAVMARYKEIVRDLQRGKPRPIYDIDERNGDVLCETWIDGFAEAVALRPGTWLFDKKGSDRLPEDLPTLSTLMAIARDESAFDSAQINALQELVPAAISIHVGGTLCLKAQ